MSDKERARAGARQRKRKTLLLRPAEIPVMEPVVMGLLVDDAIPTETMPEVVGGNVAYVAIENNLSRLIMFER
jgi:hypothetical protein